MYCVTAYIFSIADIKEGGNPAGIFHVESTLNRRLHFDGRRKSVEKHKNISTVVKKMLKFRRLIFQCFFIRRQKNTKKNIKNSMSKFACWEIISLSL